MRFLKHLFLISLLVSTSAFAQQAWSPASPIVNGTYNGVLSAAGFDLASESVTFYVDAAGGSDLFDCETSLTACETINGALASIPVVNSGVVTVNIADGTYSENLIIPNFLSKQGNSDGSTVLKFVGNSTTPANVEIVGAGATGATISHNRTEILLDVDGVTIKSAGPPTGNCLTVTGANVFLRHVKFENCSTGIAMSNGAFLTTDTSAINSIGIHNATFGMTIIGNNRAVFNRPVVVTDITNTGVLGTLASNVAFTNDLTIAGKDAANVNFGVNAQTNSIFLISGNLTVSGVVSLSDDKAALYSMLGGTIAVSGVSKTASFTNCHRAISARSGGLYYDAETISYVFDTVADIAKYQAGGRIFSPTILNGQTITYEHAVNSSADDYRYDLASASSVTTTPYSVGLLEHRLGVNTSATQKALTLPSTLTLPAGHPVYIVDISNNARTNNITVSPNGSPASTINGAASYVIETNGGFVSLYHDGSDNWVIADASSKALDLRVFDDEDIGGIGSGPITYTISAGDGDFFKVPDTPFDSVGIVLPDTATVEEGRVFIVYDAGGNASVNNITLDGNGAQTVDGNAIYTMDNDGQITAIVRVGANWEILFEHNVAAASGGSNLGRVAVNDQAYAVTTDDRYKVIAYTALSASRTISLPAAATAGEGFEIFVKDEANAAGTYAIVIDGDGAETIDGAASISISLNYGAVHLYCNGTAWFVL